MTKYKNISVGATLQTTVDLFDYSTLIPQGTVFQVKEIVPCSISGGYTHFFFAYLNETKTTCVRAFYNEISKVN